MGISLSTLAIKAAGLTGLGAVMYDAHKTAQHHGTMLEREHKTESLKHSYMNQFKADSSSYVKDAAKKKMFQFEADENITGAFTTTKGYAHGFATMLLDDAIPLGLSLGALISPKGILSKGFGLGLIGYAGLFVAQEFFGFGKSH